MAVLNVNIDHVATVRQARRTDEPDPVWAAAQCELAGANGITVHLRLDRRHILDRDVHILKETVACKLNLEMCMAEPIVRLAETIRPDQVTLVPEKRAELTTEGGLDCVRHKKHLAQVTKRMKKKGILVSTFITPDTEQIIASAEAGCDAVELHTGMYANAKTDRQITQKLNQLREENSQYKNLYQHISGIQPQWENLFKEISLIAPGNLYLDSLDIRTVSDKMIMSLKGVIFGGETPVDSALSDFLVKLENSPFFRNINLISSEKGKILEQKAVNFYITTEVIHVPAQVQRKEPEKE